MPGRVIPEETEYNRARAKQEAQGQQREDGKKTTKKERQIADATAKYNEEHPKGETLPTSTRVFRVKVVQALLKSGTPLNRMKYFRDLFEEARFPLTSSSHMSQLIPFVSEEEYKSISKEILGKELSIILDGTNRDGEALAVLARFVQDWRCKLAL